MAKKTKKAKKDKKTGSDLAKNKPAEDVALGDLHPDHDRHLCHIVGLRNMKTAGKLAKDAQHMCLICGRAAKSKKNLCEPVKI
jgi:hypothetical protein